MIKCRDDISEVLSGIDLDVYDREDAESVVDLLLESYTLVEALTWLLFPNTDFDAMPLDMLRQGRSREVMREVRRLVVVRSS